MKNFWLILLTIFASVSYGFSQSSENSAPVKWENYKISEEKITVLFPKLPVKLNFQSLCEEIAGDNYYAFAEDVVYQLKIVKKSKEKIPALCRKKIEFSENSFPVYIEMIKINGDFAEKQNVKIGNQTYNRFEKETDFIRESKWLLNDYENLRWFEFSITTFKEIEVNENTFINSLKKAIIASAIEINEGSPIHLGDDLTNQKNADKKAINSKNENGHSSPVIIITKPKPLYTEAAKDNNTEGMVRVRVTFLPNGAIGAVTPVTNLENGLTEQAIEAARKMAFLPQRQNDKKVAVTRVVVYTFSIY